MGVNGLWGALFPAERAASFSHVHRRVLLETVLRGKVVGVDAHMWLHLFRARHAADWYALGKSDGIIKDLVARADELRSFGANVLFVFDGPPPESKRDTTDARAESRAQAEEDLQDLAHDSSEFR